MAAHLAAKFKVTVTCLGGLKQKVLVAFQDLITQKGRSFPSMSPTEKTLHGSSSPVKGTKLTWEFTADVP